MSRKRSSSNERHRYMNKPNIEFEFEKQKINKQINCEGFRFIFSFMPESDRALRPRPPNGQSDSGIMLIDYSKHQENGTGEHPGRQSQLGVKLRRNKTRASLHAHTAVRISNIEFEVMCGQGGVTHENKLKIQK